MLCSRAFLSGLWFVEGNVAESQESSLFEGSDTRTNIREQPFSHCFEEMSPAGVLSD